MAHALRTTWNANRHWLAAGFLTSAALFLAILYIQHHNTAHGIAEERSNAIGAIIGDRDAISSRQPRSSRPSRGRPGAVSLMRVDSGVVGSVPGGVGGGGGSAQELKGEQQIVRTGTLNIVAADPVSAAEQARAIAERVGGFILNSTVKGDERSRLASVTLRVPAARFDEARMQLRGLAKSVEEDTVNAQDVTRQVLDQDAALRNARAAEAQYLGILKRAASVKDVLEVTEKLNEVRGDIEEKQTDLNYLRHTVEMSLLTVSISAVPRVEQPGVHWRPLTAARLSMVSALESLGEFADSVLALLLYLPVIAAWTLLVFVLLKVGWWVLLRLGHLFFPALPLWRRRTEEGSISSGIA